MKKPSSASSPVEDGRETDLRASGSQLVDNAPGMRFERDMIALIKRHLAARWPNAAVLEEFGVGYGVADVVAAQPSRAAVAGRRKLGQWAHASHRDEARVMQALRVGPQRVDALAAVTGVPTKRLRTQTLRFLAAEGLIQVAGNGLARLRGPYRPVAQEIWAVEAKLKNWFEGVCQAKRYQHFAHRVFLAIPAAQRRVVDDDVLRRLNVGLITVSEFTTRTVLRPRRSAPKSEDLYFLSGERFWGVTWSASAVPAALPLRERPQATS